MRLPAFDSKRFATKSSRPEQPTVADDSAIALHDLEEELHPRTMRDHFTHHDRCWRDNKYVYPVISRRSRGMSIGVSLFDKKVCNFDCVYCQAGHGCASKIPPIDLKRLLRELMFMLELVQSGDIWRDKQFASVSPKYRRVNDIALAGDGEPTASKQFAVVARLVRKTIQEFNMQDELKLILITNASLLHLPHVQKGLHEMDKVDSEVWAKLDVGTPAGFAQVNRANVSFEHLLANIRACGKQRPVVLQTMLMNIDGKPLSRNRMKAYGKRIEELLEDGCQVNRVQLYTVARPPADANVSALSDEQLRDVASQLHKAIPSVWIEIFGGVDCESDD